MKDLNQWLKTDCEGPYQFEDVGTAQETLQDRVNRRAEAAANTRGCKRLILENWDAIRKQYGPDADGIHVLRYFKAHEVCDKPPTLKTIRNHLPRLRTDNLIP